MAFQSRTQPVAKYEAFLITYAEYVGNSTERTPKWPYTLQQSRCYVVRINMQSLHLNLAIMLYTICFFGGAAALFAFAYLTRNITF